MWHGKTLLHVLPMCMFRSSSNHGNWTKCFQGRLYSHPLGRADRGRRRFPQRELGTLFRSTYVAELPGRTQYGCDWVSPSRGHAELGPSDCCFNTSSRWPPAERDVSLLFNVTAVHWLDGMCQSWGVGTTEPLRINISKKKKDWSSPLAMRWPLLVCHRPVRCLRHIRQ